MNNEEIEKLKEERDAAIEAGLKLVEITKSINSENWAEWHEAADKLKALKPKVEPSEWWLRITPDGSPVGVYGSAKEAESCPFGVLVVRLREVVPVEWERWRNDYGKCEILKGRSEVKIGIAFSHIEAGGICDHHNAEMARVTGTEGK